MGDWRMSADLLARARFVVSPMADVVAALGALAQPRDPTERATAALHGAAFAAMLEEHPQRAAVLRCSARPGWRADFLGIPPVGDPTTFADELALVAALGDERIRADLVETVGDPLPGGAAPAGRHGGDAPGCSTGCGPASSPATGRGGSGCCAPTSWRVPPGWPAPAGRRCCRTSAGTAPGSATAGCGSTSSTTPPATWARPTSSSFVPHHGPASHVGWELPTRYALYYPVAGVLAEHSASHRRPPGPVAPRRRPADRRQPGAAARGAGRPREHHRAGGAHRAPARVGRRAPAGAAGRRAGAATAVRPRGPLLAHRAGRRARGRVTGR